MSICLSVCSSLRSSASVCQKRHIQISPNFQYLLLVAVARSSSDGNTIRYVLPVLRMTSRFHTMQRIGQNRRRHVCFVQFVRWRHWDAQSVVSYCILFCWCLFEEQGMCQKIGTCFIKPRTKTSIEQLFVLKKTRKKVFQLTLFYVIYH